MPVSRKLRHVFLQQVAPSAERLKVHPCRAASLGRLVQMRHVAKQGGLTTLFLACSAAMP